MALSARWFDAEEALRVGFVSRVLDNKAKTIEAAVEYATLLASKSPIAVQGTKELLNHARDNTVADSKLMYTTHSVPSEANTSRSEIHGHLEHVHDPVQRHTGCPPRRFEEEEADFLQAVGVHGAEKGREGNECYMWPQDVRDPIFVLLLARLYCDVDLAVCRSNAKYII